MLQFLIGFGLSCYSAFVLKTLTDWRKNVLCFVEDILKSGKELLEEGQQLLAPVKDAADATRKSAEHIDAIAGNLKKDLPPKLQDVSQSIKDANASLIKLQPVISEAIRELPANVVGILNVVIEFLESRSPDIKGLAEDIKQVRLIVDDPNTTNDKDMVAIIDKVAKKLYEKDNSDSLSETLKNTGAKLDKAAEALGALAFVIVGSSAPITLSVLTTLSAVSFVKVIVDALTVKKGSLLSISLRYPTSDIGKKINLPSPLDDIDVTLVSAGQLIDRKIEVPERDISFAPVSSQVKDFLKKIEDAKKQAQQALDAPEIAQDITDALNATGQGLRNMGETVKGTSNTLLETGEAIVKFAPVLDNSSKTLTAFSKDFVDKAEELKPFGIGISNQSGNLQKSIDANFPTLTKSLDNIIKVVEGLDVVTPLEEVQDTAAEIKKIANLIDDGQDLDSQDKKDFRQRINNILKVLANLLRTGESFDKLFKPLYLIVVALHILLLVTGLVLVFLFLMSLSSSTL